MQKLTEEEFLEIMKKQSAFKYYEDEMRWLEMQSRKFQDYFWKRLMEKVEKEFNNNNDDNP